MAIFWAISLRLLFLVPSVGTVPSSGDVEVVTPIHSLVVNPTLTQPTSQSDASPLAVPTIAEHYIWFFTFEILAQFLFAYDSPLLYPFRYYKILVIMADNLHRALQDLDLGANDAPIALPTALVSQAAAQNRFIIIGRPLMPRRQNLRSIVSAMPRLWGHAGIIHGRIVEGRRFQFVFPSEESLESVLRRGPWAFADRMLVLQRWSPAMPLQLLNFIPFWVQIRGIPFQFMHQDVVAHIGSELGRLMDIDYDQNAVLQAEYVRVRLNWDVTRPLRFQRNFQFTPGVNTLLRLRYERLRGFCEACGMLTHDSGTCLLHGGGHDSNSDDDGSDDDAPLAFHHNQGVRIEEIHDEVPPVPANQEEAPVANGGYVGRYEEQADDPDGYAERELRRFPAIHAAVIEEPSESDTSSDSDPESDLDMISEIGSTSGLGSHKRKRESEGDYEGRQNKSVSRGSGEGSSSGPKDNDDLGGAVGPEPPLPP